LSQNETLTVTLANVLTGLGTSLTPIVVGAVVARGVWPLWPIVLIVAFGGVLVLSLGWSVAPRAAKASRAAARQPAPRTLVLFGVAALLYASCEGAFSSWATTFAHIVRGFSLATGEAALSGFWLALTVTRFIAAFASRVLPSRTALAVFPFLIALAFFALPLWRTPLALIAGFIFGGIACSIVFPYAMSLALAALPADADRVAGVMVAALMTGEGFGTFVIGALHGDAGISLSTVYVGMGFVALALAIVAMLSLNASPDSAVKSNA
jgi:fucose permease